MAVSFYVQAKIYTPNCPKEIKSIEHIQTSPNDWETVSDIPHNYLSGVSFYSGHPKEMAGLKPKSINKKNAKWTFSPKESIYIVCQYNQTGIKLTKPLPKKTTQCTINFDQTMVGDNGFLPKEIKCTR